MDHYSLHRLEGVVMHYEEMKDEPWEAFAEIVGLTLADGRRGRHPLVGRKAVGGVQGVYRIVLRMANGH